MAPDIKSNTLLSPIDAARLLNIHPVTLRKTRINGTIPLPFVRIGRSIRYREEDILSFIRANTHTGELSR
ncbi:helix-turn-helix domain-containing protein [Orrella sp. NBD-18]|uniref:Helix-turn-helix domain-containing protein n=1 Tax=Sheuella amnicola TaxID=2707330 RepID=A0A6B2R4B9_9BURK|nr:helix-turn-helix domain-containing protein [Sheuella amnicola]